MTEEEVIKTDFNSMKIVQKDDTTTAIAAAAAAATAATDAATVDGEKSVLRTIILDKIRDKFRISQEHLIRDMNHKLDITLAELFDEVKRYDIDNTDIRQLLQYQNGILTNGKKPLSTQRDKYQLPEKKFTPCNSLLTDLMEVQHIRTIYHIFIVILVIMFLHTLVYDYVVDRSINVGLFCIQAGFARIHIALAIWCLLQIIVFGLYYCFHIWATIRHAIRSNRTVRTTWDAFCIIAFISYLFGLLILSIHEVHRTKIGEACAMAILFETIRFLMKCYAFVRSNVPRVLNRKTDDSNSNTSIFLPSYKTYIYFLFAPTLVYRDNYPRTKYIRWKRVAWNYLEVLATIFYMSFVFERFFIPYYKDFGKAPIEPSKLVLAIFGCIMPGTTGMLCAFYCLLHAWMNASAEILKFADRCFYKDWWNASSFGIYYRTWNIVVHDWLYTYIYRDMYEYVCRGSKVVAALVTFTISAIFHEIIIIASFRFFYPVLFIMFLGVGSGLSFVNAKNYKNIGNILFWLSFTCGNGLLLSLYTMEFFAHLNCDLNNDSFWHQLVPASVRCYTN